MVSIICCFCDKDVKYLNRFIDNLKCFSTRMYEVIFIDDRKDKSIEVDTGKYPCYQIQGNKGTFYARRYGATKATGEWIWFVDVDDKPYPFKMEYTDCEVIAYIGKIFNEHFEATTAAFSETQIISLDTMEQKEKSLDLFFGASLWYLIIKKELLLKAYEGIEWHENFVIYEDCGLLAHILKHCNKARYVPKHIYDYTMTDPYLFKNYPEETKFFLSMIPEEYIPMWERKIERQNRVD